MGSSEFINVVVDALSCLGIAKCQECIKICPVNLFEAWKGYPRVVEENQDECTLCNLCLEVCKPKAITIRKLYQ